MVDFNSVMLRLKNHFGVTKDNEIAKILGINPGNYSDRSKRGSIPYEQIIISLENSDADLHWILYGVESKNNGLPQTAFIQFYSDENTSDGDGNLNCSGPYEMIQIDSKLFKDSNIHTSVAIRITNISMSPSMNENDIVIVDRSIRNIINGKIYVVDIKGMVMITRIFKMPDIYILRPDNNNFPEQTLMENDFMVLGRVVNRIEHI